MGKFKILMNKYIFLVLILVFGSKAWATHLRAGEITAKRISSTQLTYKVTLITYTDQINGRNANDGQEKVDFYFGFSTSKVEGFKVSRKKKTLIGTSTVCNVYDTTFTFPAAGKYTISCGIINRNEKTVNLPQPSENISFFVQTTILISPSFGLNSTPVLLNIPIDTAALGQKFFHNPGAFDIDGDSLSYKLTTPQKDKGVDTGIGEFINGYLAPESIGKAPILSEDGKGPATFKINARTGDLIWDVPREIGQYNIAFIIEEWRKAPDGSYIKIGEIVRDMQIIVVESDNNRPDLTVPPDACVEAGKKLEFDVTAKDKDDQVLRLFSAGGIYNLDASGNKITFINPEVAVFKATPTKKLVRGTFTWNTNCTHVRSQAYDVSFKVEDVPGRFNTQLVDIKTVKINVIPPRANGISAKEITEGVQVTWNVLTACKNSGKILVYRKTGCSGLIPGACEKGMPADWSYALVGTKTTGDSVFVDKTAEKGVTYSYRLVTEIAENSFTNIQGPPSAEFCIGAEIKSGMNVMTKVSITNTSKTTGSVDVAWTKPIEFIKADNKGPYEYKLYRAAGISNENYELIYTKSTLLDALNDTTYIDKNLNTEELVYKYKVEFYIETSKKFSTSSVASTVKMSGTPGNNSLTINWQANVPWSNDNQTHLIYRENKAKPGDFSLIKKITVTNASTYTYKDEGKDEEKADGDISTTLINGEKYCYYVTTLGAYPQFASFGVLKNLSQVFCLAPADNSPPCIAEVSSTTLTSSITKCKELKLDDYCNDATFVNKLTWNNPTTTGCRQDISGYNIYFARYEDETPRQVGSSNTNSFNHKKNSQEGFAGCYYITSKNSFNIESKPSNKICFDNCDNIAFPNVFTPNGDGKNDTFTPLNCPAFVQSVSYEIYSSKGLRVAQQEANKELNWDGKDLNGKQLASGVYYYIITVTFEKLSREGTKKTFKGYVSLLD
jgi:gliding motility-associated-like protein